MNHQQPVKLARPVIPWLLIMLLILWSTPAGATDPKPSWWDQAAALAQRDGYHVIDYRELWAAMTRPQGAPLLIDVRPDYEFKRGHIPGAVNLEFHLGHRRNLPDQMAQAFRRLASGDLSRRIVIYCRSFK